MHADTDHDHQRFAIPKIANLVIAAHSYCRHPTSVTSSARHEHPTVTPRAPQPTKLPYLSAPLRTDSTPPVSKHTKPQQNTHHKGPHRVEPITIH